MIISQQLKAVKTNEYDVKFGNNPPTHIRETLTFDDREEAFNYQAQHRPHYGSGVPWNKNGDSYITREIWELPTWINKARLRLNYSKENNVYTLCACCGRELHELNAKTHTKTKYGIIGPECINKLLSAGIEF